MRCLTIIAALAFIGSTAAAQPVKPGARAPNINLPALTGDRVQLSKLRGHPVVVSFWATWVFAVSCRVPRARQTASAV